jgi:REP element-mobilizing transposase RayT
MTKPLREILQGATYHCYTRCHGKKNLFHSSYVRKYLVDAIIMCQEKYEFELIAAEPVGNHIHLIIKTVENQETISRIMQYIKARIAEKYNRAVAETGAFWNERFGSNIIEKSENPEQYLLWLLWYIGFNPVRKKLSRDPRENYIGFINCYLVENFKAKVRITLHCYFNNLGNSFNERVVKFLQYEEAYLKRFALYF